jgi:urea transport system substrate-binding protein
MRYRYRVIFAGGELKQKRQSCSPALLTMADTRELEVAERVEPMSNRSAAPITLLFLAAGAWLSCHSPTTPDESGRTPRESIRVGVLHSLSGTMAISEKSVADATLLAIEGINRQGGLLGRKIEPVIADGRSDWPTFAREAERLITQEKVSAVFGCWTSASRKTVKPVFEKHDHLLFYPVQYEGLEQSPNIVYTGAAPNQQILPAVRWCFENLGRKFFLVGSDYVFPRTANEIIRDQLKSLHGEILGEEYILLGSTEVQDVVQNIVAAEPDVILNTINGDTNVAFFRELRAAGITPEKIPTMSFSIAEDELRSLELQATVGDYASWNYFQSVDREENEQFVQRFQEEYGRDRVTDDPMEAAYSAVHLWAQAVGEASTDDAREVRKAVANQRFEAPGGTVYVDPRNNHVWKTVRIGKVMEGGQFAIVWSSDTLIRPAPYPGYRLTSEWEKFLDDLYKGWGEGWANPGP